MEGNVNELIWNEIQKLKKNDDNKEIEALQHKHEKEKKEFTSKNNELLLQIIYLKDKNAKVIFVIFCIINEIMFILII